MLNLDEPPDGADADRNFVVVHRHRAAPIGGRAGISGMIVEWAASLMVSGLSMCRWGGFGCGCVTAEPVRP
jgi:hypothetical protein